MKKESYINLILREAEGLISEDELALLEKWKTSSEENRIAAERIQSQYQEEALQDPIVSLESGPSFQELKSRLKAHAPQPAKVRTFQSRNWLVAASVLLLLGFGLTYTILTQNPTSHFSATSDSDVAILPDQSQVWMTKESQVSYKTQGQSRMAKLNGKAFFDITEDPSAPFIVEADHAVITVLGTSFEVDATSEDIRVGVISGKVRVSLENGSNPVELQKGDLAIVQPNRILIDKKVQQPVAPWRSEQIAFNNLTVEEGLKLIMEFYPITLEVVPGFLTGCKMNGSIGIGSISSLLEVLESMLNAEIQNVEENKYLLLGDVCQ